MTIGDAVLGLVFAGGIVYASYKYFKNRGEKEVQIINVTKPEKENEQGGFETTGRRDQEEATRSGRDGRDGGRGRGGTSVRCETTPERTRPITFRKPRVEDESTIVEQTRKRQIEPYTNSRDQQEHKTDRRTTPHTKYDDSKIPEVPSLD